MTHIGHHNLINRMSIEYISMHVGDVSTAIRSPITSIRFVPESTNTRKTYYLTDMDIDPEQFYTLNRNKNTWRRLIIWNVPDGDKHVAEVCEVFRRIGGFTRIERLYTDKYRDDEPISITFDTWNVNDFTDRLVEELTSCDIHNRDVSSYDKRYVTLFYCVDGQRMERELFVELSWEQHFVDTI